uniref:Uncharacterized protein n=1 Tax=Pyramimonas obovata TaxID=1411642 RepID=A0A7S0RZ01_9CHLO
MLPHHCAMHHHHTDHEGNACQVAPTVPNIDLEMCSLEDAKQAESKQAASTAAQAAPSFWRKAISGAPLVVGMSFHALVAGLLLGVTKSRTDILLICWAIVAHKAPETISLATKLIKDGMCAAHTLTSIVIFSFVTPFGILLGIISSDASSDAVNMTLSALSAGTFLFMGTVEAVVAEMHDGPKRGHSDNKHGHHHDARELLTSRLTKFGFYTLGMGVILLSTFLQSHAEHDDHEGH